MRADAGEGRGLGKLAREAAAQSDRIRRRAGGKRLLRVGRALFAALALALVLCTALPPFAWPIRGRVTSAFFFRRDPLSSQPLAIEFHHGLDLAASAGTAVHATAPGLVIEAGRSAELGNFVRVRHLFGLVSTYGHLSRIDARKGEFILLRSAQSLGAVGSTGRSTGPHLHFAISADSLALPPRPLLVFHSLRRAIVGF
jgi:Membrane proteins related to metalloendopeptidases